MINLELIFWNSIFVRVASNSDLKWKWSLFSTNITIINSFSLVMHTYAISRLVFVRLLIHWSAETQWQHWINTENVLYWSSLIKDESFRALVLFDSLDSFELHCPLTVLSRITTIRLTLIHFLKQEELLYQTTSILNLFIYKNAK